MAYARRAQIRELMREAGARRVHFPGGANPDGHWLSRCPADGTAALAYTDIDTTAPRFELPLNRARPWRAAARSGEIYSARHVTDARSEERTIL